MIHRVVVPGNRDFSLVWCRGFMIGLCPNNDDSISYIDELLYYLAPPV
jgi:hypothetical protein